VWLPGTIVSFHDLFCASSLVLLGHKNIAPISTAGAGVSYGMRKAAIRTAGSRWRGCTVNTILFDNFRVSLTKCKKTGTVVCMNGQPVFADYRSARSSAILLSLDAKLKVDALATMHQKSAAAIIESAVLAYVAALPDADRTLVESLAARAKQSLASRRDGSDGDGLRTSKTVNGKEFTYRGSIDSGIEVLFENSQPLRITHESINRIKQEIVRRKGPALMGAIYSPLMPNSIGEAIQQKYKLTPINLSYVIPLLCERNEVRAFKEGRNWYVQAVV
jgi:hypothetical protein